jgi:hypothetical protein
VPFEVKEDTVTYKFKKKKMKAHAAVEHLLKNDLVLYKWNESFIDGHILRFNSITDVGKKPVWAY